MEPVTRRLARTFGWGVVRAAMERCHYGDEEGLESNPRRWDFEKLQAECREIVRAGVG